MDVADTEEISAELRNIVSKVMDTRVDRIVFTADMSIRDDLGLHSVDLLQLVFEVEQKWNIEIEDTEFKTLNTVADVVQMIHNKVAAAKTE